MSVGVIIELMRVVERIGVSGRIRRGRVLGRRGLLVPGHVGVIYLGAIDGVSWMSTTFRPTRNVVLDALWNVRKEGVASDSG